MTNIIGEGYAVNHDPDAKTISMEGIFRLNGFAEYEPVTSLLMQAFDSSEELTLNLKSLSFLNSSGIAVLSKFVIHARDSKTATLKILGSKQISWQSKSLVNLKRLMPALELEIE